MTLYSRPFVRSLRRSARTQIKLSQALRRQYKMHRRRVSLRGKLFAMYAVLGCTVLLWRVGQGGEKPSFALTVVAFYATGTAFLRSRALFARLNGTETAIFQGLPMSDRDFFRWQWKKFLLRVCWLLIGVSAAYATVAVMRGPDVPSLLAAALAGLTQCLVVAAAAPLLLKVRSPFVIWMALALYGAIALAVFLPPEAMPVLADFTIVFPAGWINRGYSLLLSGDMSGLLWFLPAAGIAILGFARLRGVRESYRPASQKEDLVGEGPEEPSPRVEVSPDSLPHLPDQRQPTLEGFTAVREPSPIGQDRLDVATDWTAHGLLERLAGTWLTREERIVADFLTGGRLGQWTSSWIKAFYVTAATVVLVAFVPSLPALVSNIAAFLAASFAAPLFGGHWLGFATVQMSPQQSFAAAFYPVSYWRVSRVIFKINLVRLAGWFILLVPVCIAFTWRHGMTPGEGLFISVKIIYLMVVAQFIAIMAKHSKGTNDTKHWSPGMIAFVLFIFVGLPAAVAALFIVFDPKAPAGWGAAILTVLAFLAWWLYGLLYNRSRIDLLHEPDARF